MDAREKGRLPATDEALDAFLASLPSPSSEDFFQEQRQRRKNLRERKWRRFYQGAVSLVAVSAGGALGIVAYGSVAGVPQRDIVDGALSVLLCGPLLGMGLATMVLIQVAAREMKGDAVRGALGADRGESLLAERPWKILRWLVFGGPVACGIVVGNGIGAGHGSAWGAMASVIGGIVLALILLAIAGGHGDDETSFD